MAVTAHTAVVALVAIVTAVVGAVEPVGAVGPLGTAVGAVGPVGDAVSAVGPLGTVIGAVGAVGPEGAVIGAVGAVGPVGAVLDAVGPEGAVIGAVGALVTRGAAGEGLVSVVGIAGAGRGWWVGWADCHRRCHSRTSPATPTSRPVCPAAVAQAVTKEYTQGHSGTRLRFPARMSWVVLSASSLGDSRESLRKVESVGEPASTYNSLSCSTKAHGAATRCGSAIAPSRKLNDLELLVTGVILALAEGQARENRTSCLVRHWSAVDAGSRVRMTPDQTGAFRRKLEESG
ncbi:hypothetical protein AB0L05_24255 [Nonomuraea pusilla]|uniref:hypothetical protein n=1 Tax=Nonomuraea pusilla TaxID=46177 RepID=UPI00331FDA9B